MRFRKGDRVEVMNHKDLQVSWQLGKILSGNGRTYCVQYDCFPGMSVEQMSDTVSRQCLRPYPPMGQGVADCIPGDVVEVFHDYSWKPATVLKVPQGCKNSKISKIHFKAFTFEYQFLVRLFGCTEELTIGMSSIRMRQIWRDDKWALIGSNSEGGKNDLAGKLSMSNHHHASNFQITPYNARINKTPQQDYTSFLGDAALQESSITSSRSLKRKQLHASFVEQPYNGSVQKLRTVEKDSKRPRMIIAPRIEKVHAVAYPKYALGGLNKHASSILNGLEWENVNGDCGSFSVRSPETYCSDSDESVGSCSVNDVSPKNDFNASIPCQETDATCSDAESCSDRKTNSISSKELELVIHRSELHAYRRTLEAFYASGPLTWDQEILLTDLRIMLHISEEEHSMELKLLTQKTIIFR